MVRNVLRLGAALLAVGSLLLTGCAQQVRGVGRYASGQSNVPDAKVEINGKDTSDGSVDTLAGNAIADLQQFWTEQMPRVFGKPYEPVKGFYSVDPAGNRPAPCTEQPSDIRGNAFYCPTKDIVAWDRENLFPQLEQRFGPFLVAMVLAHEWGHVIQHRSRAPSTRTIVVETQADCYAGSFTAHALKGNAPHFQIGRQDLDQALAGYLLFRDPVGADQNSRQAHGSGFDRISGFQEGFEQGVRHCTTFDGDRVFTEVPFTSQEDLGREGNLPYDQALELGPEDLGDFWKTSFEPTYDRPWKPLAKLTGYGEDRPSCDGEQVAAVQYCAADDTIYFDRADAMRDVYDETGDFGPMSLIAVAYGEAVRKRLGKTVNGEEALIGSICLAGAYAGDVFSARRDSLTLSPGDLDEAIQALLNYAGRSGFFEASGTVGFDRVAAFRKGFGDIKTC